MNCNLFEIMIAFLGVLIAFMQLKLSKQINEQEKIKERGYFIIEKTNLKKKSDENYDRFIWLYDLTKGLRFRLYGNGDVFILREQIMINNIIVEDKQLVETFFSVYDEKSYYGISLPEKSIDNELLRLDVNLTLKLKNTLDYVYFEKIILEFIRDNKQKLWTLHRMNTSFESKK